MESRAHPAGAIKGAGGVVEELSSSAGVVPRKVSRGAWMPWGVLLYHARYSVQFQPDGTRDAFVPVKCYIQIGSPCAPAQSPFLGMVSRQSLDEPQGSLPLYCPGDGNSMRSQFSLLWSLSHSLFWRIMADGTG